MQDTTAPIDNPNNILLFFITLFSRKGAEGVWSQLILLILFISFETRRNEKYNHRTPKQKLQNNKPRSGWVSEWVCECVNIIMIVVISWSNLNFWYKNEY